jgi:hypothetical protein
VSLGDAVATHLPFLREQARSRMSELFRVFEVTGKTEDPENELREIDVEADRYVGIGRLVFRSSVVSDVEVASQLVASQSARIDLPAGTSGVGTGMFAVVTASTSDATLVGRRFRVEGMPAAGQTTAARFQVVEIS